MADTNRTRMEHHSLLVTTIGSNGLVNVCTRFGDNLIAHANQASNCIDEQRNGDQAFPFGSPKNGNEISVDFGRNADDKIGMNPLRTIGRLHS